MQTVNLNNNKVKARGQNRQRRGEAAAVSAAGGKAGRNVTRRPNKTELEVIVGVADRQTLSCQLPLAANVLALLTCQLTVIDWPTVAVVAPSRWSATNRLRRYGRLRVKPVAEMVCVRPDGRPVNIEKLLEWLAKDSTG